MKELFLQVNDGFYVAMCPLCTVGHTQCQKGHQGNCLITNGYLEGCRHYSDVTWASCHLKSLTIVQQFLQVLVLLTLIGFKQKLLVECLVMIGWCFSNMPIMTKHSAKKNNVSNFHPWYVLTTKKTPKVCITEPLWEEPTGHQWIPIKRDSNVESIPMPWFHMPLKPFHDWEIENK